MRDERRTDKTFNTICWMVTDASSDPQECQLRDISDRGAKLACNASLQVPDKFILLLTRDGNAARHCKVVSRSDNEFALQFLGKAYRKSDKIVLDT